MNYFGKPKYIPCEKQGNGMFTPEEALWIPVKADSMISCPLSLTITPLRTSSLQLRLQVAHKRKTLHCDHFQSTVWPHVRPNHSWFTYQTSLVINSAQLAEKQEKLGKKWLSNFAYKMSFKLFPWWCNG
jgi:hypothetical protein